MFKNTYQHGFLAIFYACGGNPLSIWCSRTENGHMKRITDPELNGVVLEIAGTNVSTTYIATPKCPYKSLGIRLPFMVMVIKNMKRYFTFEVEILDDQNFHRRFRCSNFQSCSRIRPFNCVMPLRMDDGWNMIHVNLVDFTRRAYGTSYVETTRVQVHANCRLRRIYFCETLVGMDQIPDNFKVFALNATGIKNEELRGF